MKEFKRLMRTDIVQQLNIYKQTEWKGHGKIRYPQRMVCEDELQYVVTASREMFRDCSEDEIRKYAQDYGYLMDKLSCDLYEDLALDCSGEEYIDRCGVMIAPWAKVSAHAFQIPEIDDGYGILINYGIVRAIFELVPAIYAEIDSGKSGVEKFEDAIALFFAGHHTRDRQRQEYATREEYWKSNLELGGISSIVLRFIALHEFAHIAQGHVEEFKMCFSDALDDLSSTVKEQKYTPGAYISVNQRRIEAEFSADKYALKTLEKNTASKEVMWNNTLFICAFFYWLDCIEKRIGKRLSSEHPPPRQRAERIESLLEQAIGPPSNDAFAMMKMLFNRWMNRYEPEIKIYSSAKSINEFFRENDGAYKVIAQGLTIERVEGCKDQISPDEARGGELIVSIVSDFPTRLAAGYLYAVLRHNNKCGIYSQGRWMESRQDVEKLIAELMLQGR